MIHPLLSLKSPCTSINWLCVHAFNFLINTLLYTFPGIYNYCIHFFLLFLCTEVLLMPSSSLPEPTTFQTCFIYSCKPLNHSFLSFFQHFHFTPSTPDALPYFVFINTSAISSTRILSLFTILCIFIPSLLKTDSSASLVLLFKRRYNFKLLTRLLSRICKEL